MNDEISATEAVRNFSELLNQIHYLQRTFTIRRNGEVVAVLGPAPKPKRGTLADLIELFKEADLDEDWADDMRAVRASVGEMPGSATSASPRKSRQ